MASVVVARNLREQGLEWDYSNCPLCGGEHSRTLLSAPDVMQPGGPTFQVVECLDCGMKYTNPRPSVEAIGQFYGDSYRPHRKARNARRPLRKWYPLAHLNGRIVPERRQLPVRGRGRLLDFGCGGGSFIERMAEQGWDVLGLDSSSSTVAMIRDELGLPALEGSLPHPDLVGESFDVVTMWHSLEHVHDPLRVLREAHRLLVPGGRLVVATPNIDSWPFRRFGKDWFGLDLPRHLSHFTPTTMRMMLERAGFHVEQVRWIRHSDWLRSSAKIAQQNGVATGLAKWLLSKPMSRLAAWVCYQFRQSDCLMATATRAN